MTKNVTCSIHFTMSLLSSYSVLINYHDFATCLNKYRNKTLMTFLKPPGTNSRHMSKITKSVPKKHFEMLLVTKSSIIHEFSHNFTIKNIFKFLQERNGGTGAETPRNSWASFDLRSQQPDPLIDGLLGLDFVFQIFS